MKIEVWLYQTSQPLKYDAINAYTKGDLYCIYCTNGNVVKFPLMHIFRVIEGYDYELSNKSEE